MSDHSSDRNRGLDKLAGIDMASSAKSSELAPEQELSAPPPDDIKPHAPKMEAPRIEPEVEAELPNPELPLIEPEIEVEAPKIEAPGVEAETLKEDAPWIAPKIEAASPSVEAPLIEPKLEAPEMEAPWIEPRIEAETPRMEVPRIQPEIKTEAPNVEAPWIVPKVEAEAPKVEAPRTAPRVEAEAPKAEALRETGKIMMVAPSRDKSWDRATIDQGRAAASGTQASSRFGKRRLAAIAAIAVLAAITGAIGGSLATSGRGHGVAREQSSAMASHTQALEATIKQLESEVATLKTSITRSAKGDAGQFARVNDRLDKVEKAHAESAAKLTKLNDTLDKQHAAVAPVASPTTAAANVTGSIPTTATATAAASVPLPAPKPAAARLPSVEGWVLRDVANGGAVIEGRSGIYEVYTGDPVPGLGRVDAIRKQDGRWVVVTSRGLVVAR